MNVKIEKKAEEQGTKAAEARKKVPRLEWYRVLMASRMAAYYQAQENAKLLRKNGPELKQ